VELYRARNQTEIAKDKLMISPHKDVCGLEVSMDNAFFVKKRSGFYHGSEVLKAKGWIAFVFQEMIFQSPVRKIFSHHPTFIYIGAQELR